MVEMEDITPTERPEDYSASEDSLNATPWTVPKPIGEGRYQIGQSYAEMDAMLRHYRADEVGAADDADACDPGMACWDDVNGWRATDGFVISAIVIGTVGVGYL